MPANRSRAQRSTASKAAIELAARERFAADGYERATIRAIAADAGIDPAMVIRYFGNKERLFAIAAHFDLRLPDLALVPTEELGAAVAAHLFDRWEGDETLVALMRAAATNDTVADRMRQIFTAQVAPSLAAVCPPGEAPMRAGLVASQALGFAWCRYVLRMPPVVGLSRDDVVAWLGPTLQRYLAGDSVPPV